jgi:ribonuclease P protein component
MTVYALDVDQPTRFGFITAKTVGNAVVRNRARRRLKAVCHLMVREGAIGSGFDVVIRAHPPIALAAFAQIEADLRELVAKTTLRAPSLPGRA